MTWAKLLANHTVTALPATPVELTNLRSIVARSLKDVKALGLSADARFIMAYDAARTLSLIVVRAWLSPQGGRRTLQHLRCLGDRRSRLCRVVRLLRRLPH